MQLKGGDCLPYLRRETYAADEALQNQEKDKQAQDSLVNHLHRQISAHSVKLARLKAEIAAASAKAGGARRDATETGEAAARVQDEVKGLLRQWREALTGLNNRDAAFQVQTQSARLSPGITSLWSAPVLCDAVVCDTGHNCWC